MNFPKIYLGKLCPKIFFSNFSQLLLTSSFYKKGNSCEIENSTYFDAMVKMAYILEYFLYCKIIFIFGIIFSYLFSVYFADPVRIFVFFSILNLSLSMYAIHDV